jgi:hypothetical protein
MEYKCVNVFFFKQQTKRIFDSHMSRKISCIPTERVNSYECVKCKDVFSTENFLAHHTSKCNGTKALQCATLGKEFNDRS